MKNFIKQMLGGDDGIVSSKRVSGFLALLFFFLVQLIGIIMLCVEAKIEGSLISILWLDAAVVGGFFGLTFAEPWQPK